MNDGLFEFGNGGTLTAVDQSRLGLIIRRTAWAMSCGSARHDSLAESKEKSSDTGPAASQLGVVPVVCRFVSRSIFWDPWANELCFVLGRHSFELA